MTWHQAGMGLLGLLALALPATAQTPKAPPPALPVRAAAGPASTTPNPAPNSPVAASPAPPAALTPGALTRGLDCMIQPSQIVQIGSPAPGVIERILVDRGDMVQRGQELVQLNASVERASLALARERAAQQGEMAATRGARDLAEKELARADELYRKKFVSDTYLDKQRAEASVATGRSDEAQERRKLAHRELELATAQLAQRTLRSPVDGVVVERSMALGEYVDQKPVLRLAAIDPLRVDVLVPAAAFGQVRVGTRGTVLPDLIERRPHNATVKTVDRVIDAASNTFRVRLELPNPGGALPAGLRCKVDLLLGGDAAPAALQAPPAAAPMPAKMAPTAAGPARSAAAMRP